MIEIRDLIYSYDKKEGNIINNLNLTIAKNDKVSIIGKSGCGKTTLLMLLASILKPKLGTISIDDTILSGIREETGIIFQNGGLFPWKTVYENLEISLKKRLTKIERERQIMEALKTLDILPLKDKYIKELSGGEKQRVAIGRVLVRKSDLLLLDEPSSSLDAMTKENFQNTLITLYENYDLTSIIVTHDIEEAVYLGQKIIIMKDGRIDSIINNDLYGEKDLKKSLRYYEKCIEIRRKLE